LSSSEEVAAGTAPGWERREEERVVEEQRSRGPVAGRRGG
jgi:hypothetical protein